MIKVNNFFDNENVVEEWVSKEYGAKILRFDKDMSVTPATACMAYYMSKMNCKARQIFLTFDGSRAWTVSAGAMQWIGSNVQAKTGVKGVGDFFGKTLRGSVTGESGIKPEYTGVGCMALEPTYKYFIPVETSEFGGALVMNDGMYYCSTGCKVTAEMITSLSGATLGGEGLFNCKCVGDGLVLLESDVPREELIEIVLDNDVVKIDGNMAVCWTSGLQFTVERVTKTLIGSAASGEGLVNCYRGTGKILMKMCNVPDWNRA